MIFLLSFSFDARIIKMLILWRDMQRKISYEIFESFTVFSYAWWMVLSGQIAKSAPVTASSSAEEAMSSATLSQSPVYIFHVLCKRVRVYRYLGMYILTHFILSFRTDCCVAEGSSLRTACNNSNMFCHDPPYFCEGRNCTA